MIFSFIKFGCFHKGSVTEPVCKCSTFFSLRFKILIILIILIILNLQLPDFENFWLRGLSSFEKKTKSLLERVVYRCSSKQVFLKISQIPQENTCAEVSLIMSQACFPMKFAKLLRKLCFTEHLW